MNDGIVDRIEDFDVLALTVDAGRDETRSGDERICRWGSGAKRRRFPSVRFDAKRRVPPSSRRSASEREQARKPDFREGLLRLFRDEHMIHVLKVAAMRADFDAPPARAACALNQIPGPRSQHRSHARADREFRRRVVRHTGKVRHDRNLGSQTRGFADRCDRERLRAQGLYRANTSTIARMRLAGQGVVIRRHQLRAGGNLTRRYAVDPGHDLARG